MLEAPNLKDAAVKAVAAQLNDAMKRGRQESGKLGRTIQGEVDSHVELGPARLSLPFSLVILAVFLVGGVGGFLWAAAARNGWTCALFLGLTTLGLTTLGVYLLDQVRLMQRRDTALKTGLYLSIASPETSE